MLTGEPGGVGSSALQNTDMAWAQAIGVDMGFEVDPGEKKSVPIHFEYGISDVLDVFLDFSAYEKVNLPGNDGEGMGDTSIGLRTLLFDLESGTRAVLEGRTRFPTGDDDDGTGTGSVDWFALGVLSQAFEQGVAAVFLELGVLGNAFSSDAPTKRLVGGSLALNVTDRVLAFSEIESEQLDELNAGTLRLGVAWVSGESTTIDVGLSLGLNEDASDAVYFVGFSTVFNVLRHKPLPDALPVERY